MENSFTLALNKLNDQIYQMKIGDLPPARLWNQPGYFNEDCKVMFIGQNPGFYSLHEQEFEWGRNQDRYIESVKKSPTGKLLTQTIEAAQLTWDDVSYTNVVKSPTLDNREPTANEAFYYAPILVDQINLVKPQKIIVFSKFAHEWFSLLVRPYAGLGKDILYVYHPAYVLRTGKVVEYIQQISQFLKE